MRRWDASQHEVQADQHAAVRAVRRGAAGQAGRFTSAQAQRLGCRDRTLLQLRAAGEIASVRQGVWRFVAAPSDARSADWETVLATGGGSGLVLAAEPAASEAPELAEPDERAGLVVLSGATALARMGVERAARHDRSDVLVTGCAAPRVSWARVHRTRQLEPCDVTTQFGPPMTTATRALIELSAGLAWVELLALLDEVLCARLASRSWLHRRATTLRPGRPRVQWLVEAVHPEADADFRSWLERTFGRVLAGSPLPAPRWNVAVSDERGRIGVVDLLWERSAFERDLVVELEGLRFHTAPAQRRRDARRFNRLSRRHAVLRFTWEDVVRRPAAVVAEIADRLELP